MLLDLNDISKSYVGEPILSNISMKIEARSQKGRKAVNSL